MPSAKKVRVSASLRRLDFPGAFARKVCPYAPCAFALFQPDDRAHPSIRSAIEMQGQVLASAFRVSEMFEVYDAAIGQAQKIHGNADYQVSKNHTKKKNPARSQRGRKSMLLRSVAASERVHPIRRCFRSI